MVAAGRVNETIIRFKVMQTLRNIVSFQRVQPPAAATSFAS